MKRPGKRPSAVVSEPKRVVRPRSQVSSPLPEEALAKLRKEVDITAPPKQRMMWAGALREILGQCVITDRHKRPISYWAEVVSDIVPKNTVLAWAKRDKWLSKRVEFFERVRDELLREVGAQHVRQWVEDLKGLDALHNRLERQLKGEDNACEYEVVDEEGKTRRVKTTVVPPAFGSRGDAMRSFILLDRQRDEKRKNVLGALPMAVGAPTKTETPVEPVTLTPAVARAMAKAKILAERSEIERDVDKDEDEDK